MTSEWTLRTTETLRLWPESSIGVCSASWNGIERSLLSQIVVSVANTDYIARLRELLLPRVSDELEVLSVRSTIRELLKTNQPSEIDDET